MPSGFPSPFHFVSWQFLGGAIHYQMVSAVINNYSPAQTTLTVTLKHDVCLTDVTFPTAYFCIRRRVSVVWEAG
jgi:hypothetical protein